MRSPARPSAAPARHAHRADLAGRLVDIATVDDTGAVAPRLGTLQGLAQTSCFGLLMAIRSSNFITWDDSPTLVRTEAFGPVVLAFILVFCVLGATVDVRRRDERLALVAPAELRYGIAGVSLAGPFIYLAARGADPFVYLCAGTVVCPYLLVTVDRIVGPAWVLRRTASRAWARRRWLLHRVVEVGEARAIVEDGDGRRLTVRTELPIELGPVYLVLAPARNPADPYRSDDADATLCDAEPTEERARRRGVVCTAALAVLSGLAWIALPLAPMLADAITDCVPPPEYPTLCG